MDARVREVADQTALIAPSHRYHFAGHSAPIEPAYRYHFAGYGVSLLSDSMLRIHSADYQAVPASVSIMTRLVAVKDLRCAPTTPWRVLDSSLRITH